MLGLKTRELRSWVTPHRGRLGIHIAANLDRRPLPHVEHAWSLVEGRLLPPGHLVGEVTLVDVRRMRPEDALVGGSLAPFQDLYAWVLEAPLLYPEPIILRGQLKLWDYHSQAEAASVAQLHLSL